MRGNAFLPLVLLVASLAAAGPARAETDPLGDPAVARIRDAFKVDGIALFDPHSQHAPRMGVCAPSIFAGLKWCVSGTAEETKDGATYVKTTGYNIDGENRIVYAISSRRSYPLKRGEFDGIVRAIGERFGARNGGGAAVYAFKKGGEAGEVDSLIAVWGGIRLVHLSEAEYAVVEGGGSLKRGHLVDHRFNLIVSAKQRDPVYKIEGDAGYILHLMVTSPDRADVIARAVYQPVFLPPPAKPGPEANNPLVTDSVRRMAPPARDGRSDDAARSGDARRMEAERALAAERLLREEAERKAAEEKAARAEAERSAREAERKAAEERRALEEAKKRAEAEKKAAEERAAKAEAELKANEERRKKEEAERKSAEERAKRAERERASSEDQRRAEEAERKAAEEHARRAESERKIVEERRRSEDSARVEAERKAAAERRARDEAERKAAEEKQAREEAERKAAEAKRAREELERAARAEAERKARVEAEQKAAAEKRAREEAERKAVEEKTREEKARRSEEGRKGAEERADADRADPDRGDAARRSEAQRLSKERTERPENWHKLAAEAAKTAGAIWSLAETQDRVAEERVLRSQTVFGGPDHGGDSQLAVEVTFECTIIGRDRRLRATARGFDRKSGAGVAFRTEGEGTFGVRTRFRLDDQPAQDGLLFRERRDDTASILEVPMTASDVGKDAPRAGVWLRHYAAALEFDLVAGKVSATIAPYADNLRKVLEACAE